MKTYWEVEVKLYLHLEISGLLCAREMDVQWSLGSKFDGLQCRSGLCGTEILGVLGIESWLYRQAARSLVTIPTELSLLQTNNTQKITEDIRLNKP